MTKVQYLIAFILLISCSSVFAHSKLQSSNPSNGEQLAESPTVLQLVFGKKVRLLKLKLSVGESIIATKFTPSSSPATKFEIEIPLLKPQAYKVNWVAMGGDSHKIKGKLGFTVEGSSTQRKPAAAKKSNSHQGHK